MNFKCRICVLSALLTSLIATEALAQSSRTIEGLSLAEALTELTSVAGSPPAGQAIAVSTALEVATAPFGTSAAGFVFKLDPVTGLRVRTATTFGPAFGQRVLTASEGKLNVAANLIVSTYDRLDTSDLSRIALSRAASADPAVADAGYSSLVLSSQAMVLSASVGATDSLDFSVAVPLVKVKLEGLSWMENDEGDVLRRAEGSGVASGLGDVAVQAKYRLLRFGEGEPDPGGVALLGRMRLPTGDADNLRGLGITRTLAGVIVSMGRGRFRPHANAGFEFWSKGVQMGTSAAGVTITARHQVQYAVGMELEAAQKLTLIVDVLGRHVLDGGRVGMQSFPVDAFGDAADVTSLDAMAALPSGLRKITIAPGLKWNVKGNVLVSLNALVPVKDNGLHDRFTPVVGLDWTF